MPRIASLENLHEAFLRAARGKAGRVRFCKKMDELTEQLHRQRITERVFAMRASCLHAFIDKADSADFRFTYYHSNASVEALTA